MTPRPYGIRDQIVWNHKRIRLPQPDQARWAEKDLGAGLKFSTDR